MIIVVIWVFFIILSMMIAKAKNRSADRWGALTIFFGPIGVIAVALMPSAPKKEKK